MGIVTIGIKYSSKHLKRQYYVITGETAYFGEGKKL